MTRTPIGRFAGASMLALALAAPVTLSPILVGPAHAFFGFGRIVYDPSNYAQNVLTAARTLEQINNQIQQLQNEAQMLINQARNLASLHYSSLHAAAAECRRTQVLQQAQEQSTSTWARIDHRRFSACANRAMSRYSAAERSSFVRMQGPQLLGNHRPQSAGQLCAFQGRSRTSENIDTNTRRTCPRCVGQSQKANRCPAGDAGGQKQILGPCHRKQLLGTMDRGFIVRQWQRAEALIERGDAGTAAKQGRCPAERFLHAGRGLTSPGNAGMFKAPN